MKTVDNNLHMIRENGAQRETELRADLFTAVFEAAQTGLLILHKDHRQIMDINSMAGNILGCEVDDLLGRVVDEFLPPECLPLCNAVDSDKPCDQGTMNLIRSDGTPVPVLYSRTFLGGDLEDLMVLSFMDISRQQAMEEELRRSNEQLKTQKDRIVQSEKLASIGQLAAGVAHEINNPVGYVTSNLGTLSEYVTTMQTIIEGYQQLANLEPDDPSREQVLVGLQAIEEDEDLEFILGDCQGVMNETMEGLHRVAEIVQNLKSFAREDSVERVPHDVNEGIQTMVRMVWNELKYRCKVDQELGEIPLINCHRGQINQVVMNMLVNASQAMPEEGGRINIRTSMRDEMVQISIKDNGCGMDAETLGRIFDPFFTTKDVGKGTGLGLSISHGIVTDHGGRIEVDSTPGEGSEFRILLPLGEPNVEPEAPAAGSDDDLIIG